jgi:hypothetical protein
LKFVWVWGKSMKNVSFAIQRRFKLILGDLFDRNWSQILCFLTFFVSETGPGELFDAIYSLKVN